MRKYKVKIEIVSGLRSSVKIKKGIVFVSLSRYLSASKSEEIKEKFLKWADKRMGKVSQDFVEPVYEDGGRVCVHNKIYEIVVFHKGKRSKAALQEGYLIEITLPERDEILENNAKEEKLIKSLSEKIIIMDQEKYLKEVLDELNRGYFEKRYTSCRFKRINSRFGSLSNRGNVNIAYRLLFAPREVFRYVCAHELAHLEHFNHSKKFWEVVGKVIPDYKKHDAWLRDNGFMLG